MDIYTAYIPYNVRDHLENREHNCIRLVTIGHLLEYTLMTFGIRVFMETIIRSTGRPLYKLRMENIPTNNIGMKKKDLYASGHENVAWELGLEVLVQEIRFSVPRLDVDLIIQKGLSFNEYVYTEVFGVFNEERLEKFKKVLSLYSSNQGSYFNFEGIQTLPAMAKYTIKYCEFMLGINQPIPATIIPTQMSISFEEGISPAPPVVFSVIDDTIPSTST